MVIGIGKYGTIPLAVEALEVEGKKLGYPPHLLRGLPANVYTYKSNSSRSSPASQYYALRKNNGDRTIRVPGAPFRRPELASKALDEFRLNNPDLITSSSASSSSSRQPKLPPQNTSINQNQKINESSTNQRQYPASKNDTDVIKKKIGRPLRSKTKKENDDNNIIKSSALASPILTKKYLKKKRCDPDGVELPTGITYDLSRKSKANPYLARFTISGAIGGRIIVGRYCDFETAFRELNLSRISYGLAPVLRSEPSGGEKKERKRKRVRNDDDDGGSGGRKLVKDDDSDRDSESESDDDDAENIAEVIHDYPSNYTHYPQSSPNDSKTLIDFDEIDFKFVNKKCLEAGLPRLSFEVINGY